MSLTRQHRPETGTAESKARLRLWLRLLKASRHIEAELRERLRVEFGSTLPRFGGVVARCAWHEDERAVWGAEGLEWQRHRDH